MSIEYFTEDRLPNYSSHSRTQILKIKTCTCSIGRETCPSHASDRSSGDGYYRHSSDRSIDLQLSDISLTSNNNSFATDSSITVVPKRPELPPFSCDELKLSLYSLNSDKSREKIPNDKEKKIQQWLAEKDRQRKKELKKQEEIERLINKERERKVELERESFAAWLKSKKEQAKFIHKKSEEEKEKEEKRLLKENEKKEIYARTKIKLWMKQKEEQILLNKMHEQINKIKAEEDKQKRKQESRIAYENWLKNSKDKPKPVPSNLGLESLRTSVSVAFINPTPWVPNIDILKPSTK